MEFSTFMIGPTEGRVSEADTYDSIIHHFKLTEDLGYDAVWLAEHHFDAAFSTIPSPNLLLAIAAQVTSRIKIGNAINVLPFHNPLRLAEEGAMLDLLSNGRFQWGVGRGITGHEFESFMVDASTSREAFNELHDSVIEAWKTGRMAYSGDVVNVPPTDMTVGVVQKPHPPVWVTAQSPASVAWAAANDYPAMQIGEDLEAGRRQRKTYEDEAKKAGIETKRGGIVPLRMVCVANTDDEARELCAERVVRFWDANVRTASPSPTVISTKNPGAAEGQVGYEYWAEKGEKLMKSAERGLDGLVEGGLVLCGSPDTVIDQLKRQVDALGCKHFMCDFWRPIERMEERDNAMRLFSEKVIPAFK